MVADNVLPGRQACLTTLTPYYDHLLNSVADDTDLVWKAVIFQENLATFLVNSNTLSFAFGTETSQKRTNKLIYLTQLRVYVLKITIVNILTMSL